MCRVNPLSLSNPICLIFSVCPEYGQPLPALLPPSGPGLPPRLDRCSSHLTDSPASAYITPTHHPLTAARLVLAKQSDRPCHLYPSDQQPKSACVSRTLPHSAGTSPTPHPRSCPLSHSVPASAVCTAPSVAQLYSISEFGSLPFLVPERLSPQLIAGFCSKSTSQEGAPCLIYLTTAAPTPPQPTFLSCITFLHVSVSP